MGVYIVGVCAPLDTKVQVGGLVELYALRNVQGQPCLMFDEGTVVEDGYSKAHVLPHGHTEYGALAFSGPLYASPLAPEAQGKLYGIGTARWL